MLWYPALLIPCLAWMKPSRDFTNQTFTLDKLGLDFLISMISFRLLQHICLYPKRFTLTRIQSWQARSMLFFSQCPVWRMNSWSELTATWTTVSLKLHAYSHIVNLLSKHPEMCIPQIAQMQTSCLNKELNCAVTMFVTWAVAEQFTKE
jgi:hypothetical protein